MKIFKDKDPMEVVANFLAAAGIIWAIFKMIEFFKDNKFI